MFEEKNKQANKQNLCVWKSIQTERRQMCICVVESDGKGTVLSNNRPSWRAEGLHNEDIDQRLCVWLWHSSPLINGDLAVLRVTKHCFVWTWEQMIQVKKGKWCTKGKTMNAHPSSQMGQSAEEDAWVWCMQTPPQCGPGTGNICNQSKGPVRLGQEVLAAKAYWLVSVLLPCCYINIMNCSQVHQMRFRWSLGALLPKLAKLAAADAAAKQQSHGESTKLELMKVGAHIWP